MRSLTTCLFSGLACSTTSSPFEKGPGADEPEGPEQSIHKTTQTLDLQEAEPVEMPPKRSSMGQADPAAAGSGGPVTEAGSGAAGGGGEAGHGRGYGGAENDQIMQILASVSHFRPPSNRRGRQGAAGPSSAQSDGRS